MAQYKQAQKPKCGHEQRGGNPTASGNMAKGRLKKKKSGQVKAWYMSRSVDKLCGEERPGGAGQNSTDHEPAGCPGSQEDQWQPGLYQKLCSQQNQGGDHPPKFSTAKAPP